MQNDLKNLILYKEFIEKNTPFIHVKLGDSEMLAMRMSIKMRDGGKSLICPQVGKKLVRAVLELSRKNTYFADWFYSNKVYGWPAIVYSREQDEEFFNRFQKRNRIKLRLIRPFELVMMGWGNMDYPYLFDFYKTIKESKRNKIYIGNDKLRGIIPILNIDKYVEIPALDAALTYERFLPKVLDSLCENSIVLISAGMASPLFANDLTDHDPTTTIIDVGSGFDPLFMGNTRGGGQASPEQAKEYFKNL